jgi:hypothetical protein
MYAWFRVFGFGVMACASEGLIGGCALRYECFMVLPSLVEEQMRGVGGDVEKYMFRSPWFGLQVIAVWWSGLQVVVVWWFGYSTRCDRRVTVS